MCLSMSSCKISAIKQNQKLLCALQTNNYEGGREAIEDGASLRVLYGTFGETAANSLMERNPLRIACASNSYNSRTRNMIDLLLEMGADPNMIDTDGRSVFSDAVSSPSIELCQKMMEYGGDFQKKDRHDLVPFDYFCFYAVDEWDILPKLNFLLNNGAQLSSKSLSYAIKGDHGEGYTRYNFVKRIAEKAEEQHIVMELSDLQTFVLRGDLDSLKKAIQTEKSKNYVFYTAAYGNIESMQYMLHHGGSISEIDYYGNTLLAVASKAGNTNVLKWLAEQYSWNTGQWYQALKCAIAGNHLETALYMMQIKIDISPADDSFDDVLCYAVLNRNQEMAENILKYGFPLEEAGRALFQALEDDQVEMAAFLLDKGVDMNKSYNAIFALDQACQFGSIKCIQLLLDRGADVNKCDDGFTPLNYACFSGSYEAVSILLANGADVNVETDSSIDCQPITQAIYGGSLDIVKLLVENGAIINDDVLYTAKNDLSYRIYQYLLNHASK